jgi:RHS repeat-associated protein
MKRHNRNRNGASAAGWILVTVLLLCWGRPADAGHFPRPGTLPAPAPAVPPSPPCGQNSDGCCSHRAEGKPIDLWNGREFLSHVDLELPGVVGIRIRRSYDSQARFDSALGYGWSLGYFIRLYRFADQSVILRRDCGVRRPFLWTGGAYQTPVGESGTLVPSASGWTYFEADGSRLEFDPQGRLVAQVSRAGGRLAFSYDERGRLPLVGVPAYSPGPPTPREVAQDDRLLRIEEQAASGAPTGRWVRLTYDEGTGRLQGLQDSAGRTVTYRHDGIGNLTQATLPGADTFDYGYEDPRDPHNATSLSKTGCPACSGGTYVNVYDDKDRVIRQEHGGRTLQIRYDQPLVKTTVTEEVYENDGRLRRSTATIWEFNTTGNPVRRTDALGHQRVYVLDPRMNVVREEGWENLGSPGAPNRVLRSVEEKTYDARGRLLSVTEAAGTPLSRTTTYTYLPDGRLHTVVEPSVVLAGRTRTVTYTYDDAGRRQTVTETGLLGDGTSYTDVTTYTLDENGAVLTEDGPRADVADVYTFGYGTSGVLASVTQPGGLTTTYLDHTALELPRRVVDPNGVQTTYTYDGAGRVLTASAEGDTTSFTYTPSGKLATATWPGVGAFTYGYDDLDRVTSISNGLEERVTYQYEGDSENITRAEIQDAQAGVHKATSFEYDAERRLIRMIGSANSVTEYGYDWAGNRVSHKDPNGRIVSAVYDALGRQVRITRPGDIVTHYGYDGRDRRSRVTDPNGVVTTYTYDDRGHLYRETSADAGTSTHTYDAAGHLTSRTDARGTVVQYQNDALGRRTRIDFPHDADVTYTYDSCPNGKGRLCRVVDQAGTSEYVLSRKGEVVEERRTLHGVVYVTGYGYGPGGRLDRITYPGGRQVKYSYGTVGEIVAVTTIPVNQAEQVVASGITYKPFGGIATVAYGNGLARQLTYDSQYRVSGLRTPGVQDWTYGRDLAGRITSIVDNLDAGGSRTFGYDALGRLASATGRWGSLAWTYDGVGNRRTQSAPEGASTYTYQAGTNRLEAVSGAAPATFGYDAAGNMTSENGRVFRYDDNARLNEAVGASGVGLYTYDARQRRVTKAVGGNTTVFHSDRWDRLLAETDMSGAVLQVDYVYLGREPIAKATGATLEFIHTDHLGTPQVMTDAARAKVWGIEARPFGDDAGTQGSGVLKLRFPGQYHDEETGLHQNGRRDYAPTLGRYVESDPIGLQGGLGRYVYVGASPLMASDPLGLEACPGDPLGFPDDEEGPVESLRDQGLFDDLLKPGLPPMVPPGSEPTPEPPPPLREPQLDPTKPQPDPCNGVRAAGCRRAMRFCDAKMEGCYDGCGFGSPDSRPDCTRRCYQEWASCRHEIGGMMWDLP